MYSDEDLKRVLRSNLNSEMKVICLYIDNLHKLNYQHNNKKVSRLVLDSCRHATMITEQLLALSAKTKGPLVVSTQRNLLREETGVKEIYKYESARTKRKDAQKLLKTLIKEETIHEKLVHSLR